jgi:hypothetical protein
MDINVDINVNSFDFFYSNDINDINDIDNIDNDKILVENSIFIENEIIISNYLLKDEKSINNLDYYLIIDYKKVSNDINNKKKYIMLTYNKKKDDYSNFIINILNITSNERNIIKRLVNVYDILLENFIRKNIYFIDFSYKNINIDNKRQNKLLLSFFQKCIYNKKNEKKIEKNIKLIKKIVEKMEYYGNKHILLFIIGYLINIINNIYFHILH